MLATKDNILGARTLPYEDVPCPELGDGYVIRVRCLTALGKDAYDVGFWYSPDGALRPVYDAKGARARLLQLTCVNEDGELLFSLDDLPQLNELRADVADRLFGVAQRLSGLNASIEELKAGFAAARNARSTTT